MTETSFCSKVNGIVKHNPSNIDDSVFCEMVNFVLIFQSITFFTKCPVLDVWQGSEYASESCSLLQGLKIGQHHLKKPSLSSILLKKDSSAVALGICCFYKSS